MKPAGYKMKMGGGNYTIVFDGDPYLESGLYEFTPVYTAHEIADFVRGLYSRGDFLTQDTHAVIADKIEKESQK